MRELTLSALLSLVAIPAAAQDTTTTCHRFGNTVQCDSHTQTRPDYSAILNMPNPGNTFLDAFNAAQQQQDQQRAQRLQPTPQADDVNYSRAIRAQVGEYLKAGDCETAKALALRSGEIALANEVRDYCAKP